MLQNRGEFGEHLVLGLHKFFARRPREFLYLLLSVSAAIQIAAVI